MEWRENGEARMSDWFPAGLAVSCQCGTISSLNSGLLFNLFFNTSQRETSYFKGCTMLKC